MEITLLSVYIKFVTFATQPKCGKINMQIFLRFFFLSYSNLLKIRGEQEKTVKRYNHNKMYVFYSIYIGIYTNRKCNLEMKRKR